MNKAKLARLYGYTSAEETATNYLAINTNGVTYWYSYLADEPGVGSRIERQIPEYR